MEELGPAVTDVFPLTGFAMPWLGYACSTCAYGVSGWGTLCLEQKNMGYSIDGGFGEYATAYARYVVKVPDGVDPFDAAVTAATEDPVTRPGRRRSSARCGRWTK